MAPFKDICGSVQGHVWLSSRTCVAQFKDMRGSGLDLVVPSEIIFFGTSCQRSLDPFDTVTSYIKRSRLFGHIVLSVQEVVTHSI